MRLTRIAGAGVTALLATGTLVGATSTAAHAAVVSSTYSCTPSVGSPFDMPVSVDLAFPTTAVAGTPIPAGFLSFPTTASIPAVVQTAPGGPDSLGVTGARSADFGANIGPAAVKAPTTWTKPGSADGSGNYVYTGNGINGAFILPKADSYTATMPKTFTFVGTGAGGADTTYTATCTTASPATIGTITLSKQLVTVKAKAPKSAEQGDVVTVKGKVLAQYAKVGGPVATGKVVVKDGNKTVGKGKVKNGEYKVKVKGLAKGAHSLVVTYKGDDFVGKGASKARSVTVS